MREVVVLAAPGGNPAPLVALIWVLHQEGLRVGRLEAVLYANAHKYLQTELLGQQRPLDQLREVLGDPELAHLVPTLVRQSSGEPMVDDAAPGAQLHFTNAIWQIARRLSMGELPVIYALVGGSRRTLTVQVSTTFQLLGRPTDRLVDLRLTPKQASDPMTGFFFPQQQSPATIEMDRPEPVRLGAQDIQVDLVDVSVPRLGKALLPSDLDTFSSAVAAGETALERGCVPKVTLDVVQRQLLLPGLSIKLSHDQMIWMTALAIQRLHTDDGWLNAGLDQPLRRVSEWCLELWRMPPHEISDGYDFRPEVCEERSQRLSPIRSRLRRKLQKSLQGHPFRGLIIPVKMRSKAPVERLSIPADRLRLVPEWKSDG